jgi:holo-[acyl-carrier protein] synthase
MLGIGVDIESIDRFKKYVKKRDAPTLKRLFTPAELDYCFSDRNIAQHLAARFAGKESVIKALTSLNKKAPMYKEIEILNDAAGVPLVRVNKPGFTGLDIHLSLSHGREQAIAFSVIQEI